MKKCILIGIFLLSLVSCTIKFSNRSITTSTSSLSEILTTTDTIKRTAGILLLSKTSELYEELECDHVYGLNGEKITLTELEIDDEVEVTYQIRNGKKEFLEIRLLKKAEIIANAVIVEVSGNAIFIHLLNVNDDEKYLMNIYQTATMIDSEGTLLNRTDFKVDDILCIRRDRLTLTSYPPQLTVYKVIKILFAE